MEYIGIGIDVSKGRADIAFLNQSGTQLTGSGAYDDTHAGHTRLQAALQEVRHRHPDAQLIAGVEATAGYERSWVAFFAREQPQRGKPVVVHRLNPLAVKRFLEADLHRKVDDRNAAHGIARFLLERRRETKAEAIPLDGRVTLYRTIRSLMLQRTAQQQRFHTLLAVVQPELVQYCASGIPNWILSVCRHYPTAARLSRCHVTSLAALAHVGATKAAALRTAAQTSTASMTDDGTAISMELLVDDLFALDERIYAGQQRLEALMVNDPDVARIDGIPGIARWSAIALVLEIGPIERFADVRQLIAWSGLDPRVDESGDGVISRGISHRGNAHLRAVLFPLTLAAMQHHPRIADFITAKVNHGKPKRSLSLPEQPNFCASYSPCWHPSRPIGPITNSFWPANEQPHVRPHVQRQHRSPCRHRLTISRHPSRLKNAVAAPTRRKKRKPRSPKNARSSLKRISGRPHRRAS